MQKKCGGDSDPTDSWAAATASVEGGRKDQDGSTGHQYLKRQIWSGAAKKKTHGVSSQFSKVKTSIGRYFGTRFGTGMAGNPMGLILSSDASRPCLRGLGVPSLSFGESRRGFPRDSLHCCCKKHARSTYRVDAAIGRLSKNEIISCPVHWG